MTNLKLKLRTGFRKDQCHTIDGDEAHKAYYLFLHPDERGVFSNGVALIGRNIQSIEPDYNATMGWNHEYELNVDDYIDLKNKGVDRKMRDLLALAKNVAQSIAVESINLPLSQIKLLN